MPRKKQVEEEVMSEEVKSESVEEVTEQVTEKVTEAPQSQPQAPNVQLSVGDIKQCYAAIDLAAKRGAYQANDLEAVGRIANKLGTFIKYAEAVAAQRQEAEAKQTEEATE